MKNMLLSIAAIFTIGCTVDFTNSSLPHTDNPDGRIQLELSSSVLDQVQFQSRYFGEEDWKGTLAMNIAYDPILEVRASIEQSIYNGRSLKYLNTWHQNGEAHITTITPVEYQQCMWSESREIEVIHMTEIERIALGMNIQESDLKIISIGVGRKTFEERQGIIDETHFVNIESMNLIQIRRAAFIEYLKRGGDSNCWDPEEFFPHITVGYTYKDIHFPDVRKNDTNSADNRFDLVIQ